MCSHFKTNKHGYKYCNNGFVAHEGCGMEDVADYFVPPCNQEESHMSVVRWNVDNIHIYRERMKHMKP